MDRARVAQGTDRELELLLAEAEERLDRLRSELVRRRRDTPEHHDPVEQHADISRLSEHLDDARVNWQLVRDFFRSAIEEQRAGAPWGEPSDARTTRSDRGVE